MTPSDENTDDEVKEDLCPLCRSFRIKDDGTKKCRNPKARGESSKNCQFFVRRWPIGVKIPELKEPLR